MSSSENNCCSKGATPRKIKAKGKRHQWKVVKSKLECEGAFWKQVYINNKVIVNESFQCKSIFVSKLKSHSVFIKRLMLKSII